MSRRDEEEDDRDDRDNGGDEEHPALRNHSRVATQVKHIAMKALKWALIGGAIAAVGAIGLGALVGGGLGAGLGSLLGLIPVVGWILGPVMAVSAGTGGLVAGAGAVIASGGLAAAATWGAGIIGAIGAIFSLGDASDAADR